MYKDSLLDHLLVGRFLSNQFFWFALTSQIRILLQTYTCRTLKYRVVTSEAFKTAINAATATLLGFTESTIVTTFNAADCRVPVAGTYHCYVVVLTSNADYASAKKALALPSAFEYTGSVLSKTTGLPIVVSGYQFEQPTNGPTTIPLPAVSIGASSSSRNGEILYTVLLSYSNHTFYDIIRKFLKSFFSINIVFHVTLQVLTRPIWL